MMLLSVYRFLLHKILTDHGRDYDDLMCQSQRMAFLIHSFLSCIFLTLELLHARKPYTATFSLSSKCPRLLFSSMVISFFHY